MGEEKWRPNVAYGPAGTRVRYEGTTYELIQPHTSQMGWEPTQTPALWRVARGSGSGHHKHDSNSSSSSDEGKHHSSHHHSDHKHDDHHHSDHKHDDHKHEESKPQQQQQQQQQNVVEAQPPQGPPYQWVPYTGTVPQNAVSITNNSNGKTFCVARGNVEGGIHPGYCDPAKNRCYTSFGGKEVVCEKFEILTADPSRVYWKNTNNTGNPDNDYVDGGREKDNTPVYVIKCNSDGVTYFGKTYQNAKNAYYGFNDKEFKITDFEVLSFR